MCLGAFASRTCAIGLHMCERKSGCVCACVLPVAHSYVHACCEVSQIAHYVICQLAPATARHSNHKNNFIKQQSLHTRLCYGKMLYYGPMWQTKMTEMICNMLCKLAVNAELFWPFLVYASHNHALSHSNTLSLSFFHSPTLNL